MPDVELEAPEIDDVDEEARLQADGRPRRRAHHALRGRRRLPPGRRVEQGGRRRPRRPARRHRRARRPGRRQRRVRRRPPHRLRASTSAPAPGAQRRPGRRPRRRRRLRRPPRRRRAPRRGAPRPSPASPRSTPPTDHGLRRPRRGQRGADEARLRQTVQADLANDHGGKADSYVAVLTVLAVSLFLLGLSLTVAGPQPLRPRRPRHRHRPRVRGVVGGHRHAATSRRERAGRRGPPPRASASRTPATSRPPSTPTTTPSRTAPTSPPPSPGGPTPASPRAPPRPARPVHLITSPEALEEALDDTEQALVLGADSDVVTVADAGFFYFLDRDFDRSADLTGAGPRAERLARPGLVQPRRRRGRPRATSEPPTGAYEEGRQRSSSAGRRHPRPVLAGARTDLSVLRDLLDDDELDDVIDLVEATEARAGRLRGVADRAACDAEPCPTPSDGRDASDRRAHAVNVGRVRVRRPTVEGRRAGRRRSRRSGTSAPTTSPVRADGAALEAVTCRRRRHRPRHAPGSTRRARCRGSTSCGSTPASGSSARRTRHALEPGLARRGPFALRGRRRRGLSACVPEDFEVLRADVSDIDAFTSFVGEGAHHLPQRHPRRAPPAGSTPRSSTRAVLSQFLEVDEVELFAGHVHRPRPSTATSSPDGPASPASPPTASSTAAFAAGPDETSRNIIVTRLDADLDAAARRSRPLTSPAWHEAG